MNLKYIFVVGFFLFTGTASSQDMSMSDLFSDGAWIPTVQELASLEQQSRETLENDGCASAIPMFVQVSQGANTLANIVRQALEPFYDADRDAREAIGRGRALYSFDALVQAEQDSNDLLATRNEFWVLEAECLAELGERDAAIERLFEALERIDALSETEMWRRARMLLWELVGYQQ